MKRKTYIYIVLCLLSVCVATILVFAHGGRTDANGGHYDRSTGEYHYHHGYPAHQHTNGVCPYDYDDKTDHSSGGSSSNNGYFSNGKSETTAPQETQRESESLSWEEWKEKHWKRADTTEVQTSDEDTTDFHPTTEGNLILLAVGTIFIALVICIVAKKK